MKKKLNLIVITILLSLSINAQTSQLIKDIAKDNSNVIMYQTLPAWGYIQDPDSDCIWDNPYAHLTLVKETYGKVVIFGENSYLIEEIYLNLFKSQVNLITIICCPPPKYTITYTKSYNLSILSITYNEK